MDEPIDEQEVFTHNKTLFVLNGAPMVFRMPRSEEESHLRVKRRLRAYVCFGGGRMVESGKEAIRLGLPGDTPPGFVDPLFIFESVQFNRLQDLSKYTMPNLSSTKNKKLPEAKGKAPVQGKFKVSPKNPHIRVDGATKGRRPFTAEEDLMIEDYYIRHHGSCGPTSQVFWQNAATEPCFSHRTFESLRSRFNEHILRKRKVSDAAAAVIAARRPEREKASTEASSVVTRNSSTASSGDAIRDMVNAPGSIAPLRQVTTGSTTRRGSNSVASPEKLPKDVGAKSKRRRRIRSSPYSSASSESSSESDDELPAPRLKRRKQSSTAKPDAGKSEEQQLGKGQTEAAMNEGTPQKQQRQLRIIQRNPRGAEAATQPPRPENAEPSNLEKTNSEEISDGGVDKNLFRAAAAMFARADERTKAPSSPLVRNGTRPADPAKGNVGVSKCAVSGNGLAVCGSEDAGDTATRMPTGHTARLSTNRKLQFESAKQSNPTGTAGKEASHTKSSPRKEKIVSTANRQQNSTRISSRVFDDLPSPDVSDGGVDKNLFRAAAAMFARADNRPKVRNGTRPADTEKGNVGVSKCAVNGNGLAVKDSPDDMQHRFRLHFQLLNLMAVSGRSYADCAALLRSVNGCCDVALRVCENSSSPRDPKDHVWTAEEDAILSGDNTGREFRQLASRLSYDQCKARIAFLSS